MSSKKINALNGIIVAAGIIVLSMFSACQNTDELDELMETAGQTRAVSTLKLEETTTCILATGKKISLPWTDENETTIPASVRADVKEADGWKVLYTNMEIMGYSTKVSKADKGLNYLLLYNRYTGVLKGFLYVPSVQDNNSARWLLTMESNTKLFNFAPYFALAMNDANSPKQISTSLVSNNGITQGFEKGWNCFMLELAYDENSMNQKLDISGYAYNNTSYKFNGSYKSTSNGTIVTHIGNNTDPLGIATAVGDAAKMWVSDHTKGSNDDGDDENHPIKYIGDIAGSVLNKGIAGFISSGLSRIFGSMMGTSRSVSDLQFTTNGSVTFEGTSQTPMSGYISPIAGVPLNGIGENLGVWNLETTPTWGCDACIPLSSISKSGGQDVFVYQMNFTPSYKVTTNPALGKAVSASLKTVIYEKSPWYPENWSMTPGKTSTLSALYGIPSVLYSDETTEIMTSRPSSYSVTATEFMPTRMTGSSTPAAYLPDSKYNIGDRIAFQIITTFSPNSDFTATSVKTFVPKQVFVQNGGRPYGWTKSELSSKGYYR